MFVLLFLVHFTSIQTHTSTAVLLLCGAFLFYRSQQSAVKRSLLNKEHVKQQNDILRKKNQDMLDAKKQFKTEEQE